MKNRILNKSNTIKAFTLIEIMVGMVLGLILLVAITTVYFSSTKTNRTSQGLLNAQSDVQLALDILKKDIARTGWVNNDAFSYSLSSPLPTDFASFDGGAGSDTLKLHYESCDNADPANGCAATGLDSADCIGVAVTGGDIITNSYAISANKELTCNGEPFINNVESFQVLYGQVTDTGMQYVTANNISDVSKVHSIRFGLIVSSATNTADINISRALTLLDQTVNSNDKKVRLKFESTVVVLNKPFSSNFGI